MNLHPKDLVPYTGRKSTLSYFSEKFKNEGELHTRK